MDDFTPGEQVTWLWHPRGGYGYVVGVKAEVVKVTAKRVQIKAFRWDGSYVLRSVPKEHVKKTA